MAIEIFCKIIFRMTQAEMATEMSEDDLLRDFFVQNVQQNPNIQVR